MTEHLRLIARQLGHPQRMREYLIYSTQRAQRILPITNWRALSLEQHETFAAFRVRFSEFQEHLGKTMRAVAIEEEVEAERFGSVLAFMEKLGVLESAERWKLIRELRSLEYLRCYACFLNFSLEPFAQNIITHESRF